MASDLAIIILCKNEELHLARALESVARFSKQIFVIDSYSTDKTVAIATELGACVMQNKFINHAQQLQWAIDNAPVTAEWVMRLDADEVIERDLAADILQRLAGLPADVAGVCLKRKHIFMGRWIRHGGRYPLVLLRIWRRGHGRVESRWMDEHMTVSDGRTVIFEGGFADHNLKDLTFFIDKHNWYATREAIDVLTRRYDLAPLDGSLVAQLTSRQAATKRWIKDRVYNRLPFWLGPFSYFAYRYFVQFGFLDGREGLVYHFLQGCWYRFLVGAKVVEYDRLLKAQPDKQSRRDALARIAGMICLPE